jgi:hypothetical protein
MRFILKTLLPNQLRVESNLIREEGYT